VCRTELPGAVLGHPMVTGSAAVGRACQPADSSHICHLASGMKYHILFCIQDSMTGHAVTIILSLSSVVPGHTHGPGSTTPDHYRGSTCQRHGLAHTACSYVLSKWRVASENGDAGGVLNGTTLAVGSHRRTPPGRRGSPGCYRCWSESRGSTNCWPRGDAQVEQQGYIGD
jgi:hypothetical protein